MSQVSLGKVKGDNGADGKSPYQVAVEEGYNGTEAEFYAALVSLQNAPFLPTSGGTMSGNLNLNDGVEIRSYGQDQHSILFEQGGIRLKDYGGWGSRILGLSDPIDNDDSANKHYVDSSASNLLSKTGGTMSGPLNMGGQKIEMVPTPTESTDAVNKGYVDNLFGDISSYLDAINGETI